jgi:hypothetical protein
MNAAVGTERVAVESNCRLTLLGSPWRLGQFEAGSNWKSRLKARHLELYECANQRQVWWFETDQSSLKALETLSRRWPDIVFLLDWEMETERIKGLAMVASGKVQEAQFSY